VLGASSAFAQQTIGAYLDLESISPNDVLGLSQQAGGLFVQGGFVCAVTVAGGDSCAGGTGTTNGYWNILFNEPATSLPSTFAPQYQTNPPTYYPPPFGGANYPAGLNPGSVAGASTENYYPTAALTYANSGNQVGFTLATSSAALGVINAGTADFVGTASNAVSWTYSIYDDSVGYVTTTQSLLAYNDNCANTVQAINLLNCAGSLPAIVPFAQGVSFTLSSQNGVTAPTFSWTLPSGFTPNVQRIEIWQINGAGIASTDVLNTTLTPTTTSYAVPTARLSVNQEYAVDIELLVLRNPSNNDTSNANVWTRSRSFFDFTPEPSSATLPPGTPIAIPIVTPSTTIGNTTYPTTYTFSQTVTASQSVYIDPVVATGYLYQTGTGPNFASVTPVTSIGTGSYQLYTLSGNGTYTFKANISAGQTYTFGGGGVSSFEIVGIPASADVDPSNATAFITGLTFVSNGTFNGTMTPLTTNTGSTITNNDTDGPLPAWAIAALGAALFGVAVQRRKTRA
jgi:hypothetical protein